MSSPWAKIEQPKILNFQEIMSEQIAADMAKKEEQKFLRCVSGRISPEVFDNLKDEACCLEQSDIPEEILTALQVGETLESDAEIARTLQAQFDREHDENLKRCENRYNGTSKVSISFRNFMTSTESYDEELPVEAPEQKDWDRFETMEKEIGTIPPCGYKMTKDGVIITKHDAEMNGRKNACKLLSFPPEFLTGDGENIDLQLSNKVYNSLKIHSQNAQHSRRHKLRDKREDKATSTFGLDEHTVLQLYKMVNNAQILDTIGGIISTGKEAAIFHAFGNSDNKDIPVECAIQEIPKECAIKVFKTTLSEFKDREKYIKSDNRFKDRIGKQTSKKTVHIWAEKEMANLCRMKKAGIPCPEVVMLKEYVLVMSFIGEDRVPADKLKDAFLSPAEYIVAYDQVTSQMKRLFWDAKLVHADLSEYNILWYKGQCYFIDVSTSVEPVHENAFFFLYRDCENITNFFKRKSVPEILSANELFKSITGYYYEEEKQLLRLQAAEKPKPHTMDRLNDDDNFEKVWNTLPSYNDIVHKEASLVEFPKA